MKLKRIQEVRRPDQTLLTVDKWDVTAFEDQLHDSEELGKLLETGLAKLPTFYGLLLDLFTVLFAGEPQRKPRTHPALMVNAMVIDTIWGIPEVQRLRIHCQYRRNEVTVCILRFGQAILDAIPPEMAKQAQQQFAAVGGGQPGEGDEAENDDAGEGTEGGAGQPGGDQEAEGSGEGDGPGGGPQPGGEGGAGDGSAPGEADQDGLPGDAGSGGEGPGEPSPLERALGEALRRLRPSLNQALRKEATGVTQEVKELQDLCRSQGWDLSQPKHDTESGAKAWEVCKKLLKSAAVREMYRKFGNKFRTMALASQEQKPVGKGFTTIDRTIGDDLEAVPQDELYLLVEPALRALALQAIAEGTLIQEAHQEEFERQEGDIIVMEDVSGSTSGTVSQFIKGAILGLQAIAQAQGRRLVVIPFSSYPYPAIDLTKPEPAELLRFAEMRASGGTDFQAALKAAIAAVKAGTNPDEPPDLVMYTDGECPIPAKAEMSYCRTPEEREGMLAMRKKAIDELRVEFEALTVRLKVVYVGIDDKAKLSYPDIGELAGPGNEIFLGSVMEMEKMGQVYESL